MNVILIAALTTDGFIARTPDQVSTAWTSKADAAWFAQKTKEIGVCIMGRTTFETIGRPLPGRKTIILTSQPALFSENNIPSLEQVAGDMPELVTSSFSPTELIADLEKRMVNQVALCGGASVYTQFLREGLVDQLLLTIEPVLFGDGVRLCTESLNIAVELEQIHQLSDQTVVHQLKVLS